MIENSVTKEVLLFGRHDSLIDVLLEGEHPARPFTHGEDRGGDYRRDLASETGSVQRQLALDTRTVSREDGVMVSGDRAHRCVGTTGGHRPDQL